MVALAATEPAFGHGQAPAFPTRPAGDVAEKLSDCRMTVAYVARPAPVLRRAFPEPPDLSERFYGSEPLLGVWALSCERARVAGRRTGRVIVSLVGVPVGLTDDEAPPLANFLAHALLRVDTNSRRIASVLRRAGLPGRLARGARYRHSRARVVPSQGSLVLGSYRLRVSATRLDPTNPHDHRNRFRYRGPGRRAATVDLSARDAVDRFCFPASRDCSASIRAKRGSSFAQLLGGRSASATVAFDHEPIDRVQLSVRRGEPRRTQRR
jgi:hypothetical protein